MQKQPNLKKGMVAYGRKENERKHTTKTVCFYEKNLSNGMENSTSIYISFMEGI